MVLEQMSQQPRNWHSGTPPGPVGQDRLGRYEIIRKIAESNDVVWEAWDPQVGRRVAVKELRIAAGLDQELVEERRERFKREAAATASLNHPNIVQVFDFGRDGDRTFIVMELVEAPTLAHVLDTSGPREVEEAVELCCQLLAALGHAHARGVIHRDVKLENVFVDAEGHVKLADFGIAKVRRPSRVTTAGRVFGTLPYMAPEQVRGETVDERTDLWAVGVVLYVLTSGSYPFGGQSEIDLAMNIVNCEPAWAAVPDDRLRLLLQRALAKDPASRYQSAGEMRRALQGALAQQPAVGRPAQTPNHPAPPAIPAAPPQARQAAAVGGPASAVDWLLGSLLRLSVIVVVFAVCWNAVETLRRDSGVPGEAVAPGSEPLRGASSAYDPPGPKAMASPAAGTSVNHDEADGVLYYVYDPRTGDWFAFRSSTGPPSDEALREALESPSFRNRARVSQPSGIAAPDPGNTQALVVVPEAETAPLGRGGVRAGVGSQSPRDAPGDAQDGAKSEDVDDPLRSDGRGRSSAHEPPSGDPLRPGSSPPAGGAGSTGDPLRGGN